MDQRTPFSRRSFLASASAAGAALAAASILPAESRAAPADAPVQVTEWHNWSGDSKTYEENRAKQFNATHPGIVVTPVYVADVSTKLLAAVAGGDVPDLATADPTVFGYQGGLTDLTPYLKTLNWGPDQMLPGALPFMMYNNKIWAMCELGSMIFLYINKALFRQAGLDPNKPPATLAELDAYARSSPLSIATATLRLLASFPGPKTAAATGAPGSGSGCLAPPSPRSSTARSP